MSGRVTGITRCLTAHGSHLYFDLPNRRLMLASREFGFGRKMEVGKSLVCHLPTPIFLPIKNEMEGVFLAHHPGSTSKKSTATFAEREVAGLLPANRD